MRKAGLAVPQHRDTVCRNQKQLPNGSAPGPGATRAGADVSPLGLASRRLLEPPGLWVCRGQRAPAQACCSAARCRRPHAAGVMGSGKSPGEGSRSQSFAAAVSGFTLPWEGASPLLSGKQQLRRLACSRNFWLCCAATDPG